MLIGLLFEFGIKLSKRSGELSRRLPNILEDAENGLPDCLRQALFVSFEHYQDSRKRLTEIEAQPSNGLVKMKPIVAYWHWKVLAPSMH